MNRRDVMNGLLGLSTVALPVRAGAQTPERFRAAATPVEVDSLIWLAQSQGYFRRAGLTLDIQALGSGDAIAAAMVGGDIAIGSMNIVSLAVAHQNGVDIKLVASGPQWVSGHGGSQLMVPKDSPIANGAQLNGKALGLNVLHGSSQMAMSAWVDKHGGDSTTVRWIELPFSAMQAALEQGRIAAAQISQPWATSALTTCKSLGPPNDAIAPRFLLGGYVATAAWIAEHKDAARRIRTALAQCARAYNGNPSASTQAVADLTKQDPAVVERSIRSIFGEQLNTALVQPVIDTAAKYGLLKATFPAADLIGQA
jgi:ABC-type nitrate/sulfonate/bicarbonate transport system substrate-binding protein